MGREDTSGRWEAWGCQLSQEPHPEAGTSKSCLPRLATGGAGSPPEPLAGEGREGHTALHRADEHGSWELRGQEAKATSCSEEGTCSWCGLVWHDGKAWLGR